MNPDRMSLPTVLSKVFEGSPLLRKEIRFLLGLTGKSDIELLQRVARMVRKKHFGNNVFLYGFLYFSTYCGNDCNFCHFRKSNDQLVRYRKNEEEVVESAIKLAESGVHLIDLTMGEDPAMFHSYFGLNRLIRMVKRVRSETRIPLMISPGALPESVISQLAEVGVNWFACYQETHSRTLFEKLRSGQSYDERMRSKLQAKNGGMLIEEGILTGVGETLDDIADSIDAMRLMTADQVRVMTFVPRKGTPMEEFPPSDSQLERIVISVMRLALPEALIPASLDLDGLNGLQKRLHAGANVVTSIVPPGRGLSGVANSILDIEESRRSVESILSVLQFSGMEAASPAAYKNWLDYRKESEQSDKRKPSPPAGAYLGTCR